MSSTGTTTSTSSGLRMPASTMVTGRGPCVVLAAEEAGDLLERALRGRQPDALRRALSVTSSSRSSESARWAPRLVAASAWISSMITASTPRSVSRADDVSMRYRRLGRGDEQVGRVADERAGAHGRRVAGAHADGGLGERHPEALGREADAGEGRAEVLLDVERQRPQRRDVEQAGAPARSGRGVVTSRSMPHRKAASVLPEPVGARSACARPPRWRPSPAPGPPWARGTELANHARTAGEKLARVT